MLKTFFIHIVLISTLNGQDYDELDNVVFKAGTHEMPTFGEAKSPRYLLYEVNPGEGFNLRRDVYMRVANLVRLLNKDSPWVLVLPPWGPLYHWKSNIHQRALPWSSFFDLESLGRHVPVMEFEAFLNLQGKPVAIDEVLYLQHYKEGWRDGKWEHRIDYRDCIENTGFTKESTNHWSWHFWGYGKQVYAKKFNCVSIQSEYKDFVPFIKEKTKGRSLFVVRAEDLIHGTYSEWSPEWWTARRSMVFAKPLQQIGDEFREKYLDSNDKDDKTEKEDDWTHMKRNHGDALGGPYVAVHLRRRDFLYGHKNDVPSLKEAAHQIIKALKENKVKKVFIATDAPDEEYEEVKSHLSKYSVYRFKPTDEQLTILKDGGVAIIDQWICAHARYFMGTSVSTFTFRIHEEREILGFDQSKTFNRFCGDSQGKNCEQPSKWSIKY